MNAVEIEAAISELAEAPFDAAEFPFQFLECFGHKETAIKRLRAANSNTSDVLGGVLLSKQIHMAVAPRGRVGELLATLRLSPANIKGKPQFLLATDGDQLEAEDLESGDTIACDYLDIPNHFGFLLPLGGISTVREIKENPIDVRATSRLNKLYVELLRENPEWGTPERQDDMNHFMARLVFCFFAEDTAIFGGDGLFTKTVDQMSDRDGANTHEVIATIFKAMNVSHKIRPALDPRFPAWADTFPYVNGGLFAGNTDVPQFNRTARRLLVHAGDLNWQQINPDIFGSMIQAVANAEERSNLGMHYTSVPNILKVLNPLFLDELKGHLENCGDNELKLLNLRKRLAKIRVFDPACGSGNFLVIAYKQLREIEAEINRRRNESHLPTTIPLTNFRGIEINSFPAEIARLSLIITEFQCDVLHRGQQDAISEFLPLKYDNWIVCGNALRLDWVTICPPNGKVVAVRATDIFDKPKEISDFDFENDGGETFICGNPPYKGNADQTAAQKDDMRHALSAAFINWRSLDYICGWFYKAQRFCTTKHERYAFVSTNSISQGQNSENFWKPISFEDHAINFAVASFKWSNLAAKNAGVTVVIIGGGVKTPNDKSIYNVDNVKSASFINCYLLDAKEVFVGRTSKPVSNIPLMVKGNYYGLSDGLLLTKSEKNEIISSGLSNNYLKTFKGAEELISGKSRYCLWLPKLDDFESCSNNLAVVSRVGSVRNKRLKSPDPMAVKMAETPYKFREMNCCTSYSIAIPVVSSEKREFLPVSLESDQVVFSNAVFALYDAPIWCVSILSSKIHLAWIGTVCGKLETRYRYSNTIGWNTFPVPTLTEQNKVDLTKCAEDILLAREVHFPKTIADLYSPENMPENLRLAHERNDEVLERIYIGRRFKNDTERLEKLFDMYAKLTANTKAKPNKTAKRA